MRRPAALGRRARFHDLVTQAPVGMFEIDGDGRCVFANERCLALTGLSLEEVLGDRWLASVHRDDRDRVSAEWQRAFAARGQFRSQYRFVHADGAVKTVLGTAVPLHGASSAGLGYIGSLVDVSDRVGLERERAEQDARFRATFDAAPIGMALVAPDGRFLKVNPALCELTGYSAVDLCVCTFADITHPDDLAKDLALVDDVLAGRRGHYVMEKRYLRADGSVIWVLLSVSLVRDGDGEPLYFISQIQDIDERKRFEEELRAMAERDPLTGVRNRRGFEEDARRLVAHAHRHGEAGAILLVDLDDFKAVNDTHGHQVGDEILRAVARALTERVREADIVGRMGGDEFAVVLGHITPASADVVGEAMADSLRAITVDLPDAQLSVSASIGMTCFAEDSDESLEVLLQRADEAMYRAKRGDHGVRVARAY